MLLYPILFLILPSVFAINRDCLEPVVVGTCRDAYHRYYYNKIKGQCEIFIYGGCGGNSNNFYNIDSCERTCMSCSLEPDPGRCMASMERFYFSTLTGNCHTFIYGGCGGNGNNFFDRYSCLSACSR